MEGEAVGTLVAGGRVVEITAVRIDGDVAALRAGGDALGRQRRIALGAGGPDQKGSGRRGRPSRHPDILPFCTAGAEENSSAFLSIFESWRRPSAPEIEDKRRRTVRGHVCLVIANRSFLTVFSSEEANRATREADVFSGSQPRRGKSQSPVTRVAGWRETETLKPTDEALGRRVRESPGRNESKRTGGPEILKPRRPSLTVERRRQHGLSHLADAARRSGGVIATAR